MIKAGSRSARAAVVALAIGMAALVTGCGHPKPSTTHGGAAASSASPASTPRAAGTVPLTATTPGPDGRLIADVSIGGKTLKVLVDTGSTGLRVVADKVPSSAVQKIGPKPAGGGSFGSGTQTTGDLAKAVVHLGSYQTSGPIPIELVTGSTCAQNHPNCPAANGKKPEMFGGQYDGILGIGVQSAGQGLVNPLWRLQGGIGRTFAIHYDPAGKSSLLLGVPAAGYTEVKLQTERSRANKPSSTGTPPSKGSDVPPPWNPRIPACFTLATLPGGKTCEPTMFDTGTPTLKIETSDTPAGQVPANTTVGLSTARGRWSHTYTTGPSLQAHLAGSAASAGAGSAFAGLPAYASVDVRYDLATGTIGFHSR
ncbi:DUF3443 family protein [Streptomyces sp. YGL11-2]|uniref:DUF3443 family protein n=1 Tax=Streptomyces sp. YGL11-2 TaxID=3414028 RepID=UPI003CF1FC94